MCYTHQRHSEDVDSMIILTELMIYSYGYDKYIRCLIPHFKTHYYYYYVYNISSVNLAMKR